MDDQGYGVYKFYFNFLRNFGAFPFRIEYPGTKLGYHHGGPFKWFYYLNFVAVTFGSAFQLAQLLLTITYDPQPMNVVAQLCWMFAICIPLSNYLAFIGREDRVVIALDNWCHLERSIIGKERILLISLQFGQGSQKRSLTRVTFQAPHSVEWRICPRDPCRPCPPVT